jgi:hypothetical protein
MGNFYIALSVLAAIILGGAIWGHFRTENLWKKAERAQEKKQIEIQNTLAKKTITAEDLKEER